MGGVDIGTSEHSEGEPSTSRCSADSVRHVEVSLDSIDTPERARNHDDTCRSERRDNITTLLSVRLGTNVVQY